MSHRIVVANGSQVGGYGVWKRTPPLCYNITFLQSVIHVAGGYRLGIGDALPVLPRMGWKLAVLLGFLGILFAGNARQAFDFCQFCKIYHDMRPRQGPHPRSTYTYTHKYTDQENELLTTKATVVYTPTSTHYCANILRENTLYERYF